MKRAKIGMCDACAEDDVYVRTYENAFVGRKVLATADLCFFCENLPSTQYGNRDDAMLARLIVRAMSEPTAKRRNL